MSVTLYNSLEDFTEEKPIAIIKSSLDCTYRETLSGECTLRLVLLSDRTNGIEGLEFIEVDSFTHEIRIVSGTVYVEGDTLYLMDSEKIKYTVEGETIYAEGGEKLKPKALRCGMIAVLDEPYQIFRINHIAHRTVYNQTQAYIDCEHISYILNDHEMTNLHYTGTPAQGLAQILSGSGLEVGECVEKSVSIDIHQEDITKRNLLMQFLTAAEVEMYFDGLKICLTDRRGSETPIDIMPLGVVSSIAVESDIEEGDSYELTTHRYDALNIGDNVGVDYKPMMGARDEKRVLSVTYNPFYSIERDYEIGNYVKTGVQNWVNDGGDSSYAGILEELEDKVKKYNELIAESNAYIAGVKATADESHAMASLFARKKGTSGYEINASVIVQVVNDSSEIILNADKIQANGQAVFTSDSTTGQTVIDGSYIKTGTIDVSQIKGVTSGAISFGSAIDAKSITIDGKLVATQSWVEGKSYLTSNALCGQMAGYATKNHTHTMADISDWSSPTPSGGGSTSGDYAPKNHSHTGSLTICGTSYSIYVS